MSDEDKRDDQDLADEWAAALEEAGQGGEAGEGDAARAEAKEDAEEEAKPADFEELEDEEAEGEGVNLDMILDIPVVISMEIGRTQISIRNLLKLNQGSVVELDRLAGEPLDVMVNGTLIAHGEVVVVNEKFGIRLTDVISAMERVKKLK